MESPFHCLWQAWFMSCMAQWEVISFPGWILFPHCQEAKFLNSQRFLRAKVIRLEEKEGLV